ncbi:hypothetical protein HOU47_gp54 [Arthrobacter phage Constance]|uniref:Uncharacterized protein n=1 Tax=Arthrobacter phage Constance TaxID=2419950 RepID=A0A3G2KES2_9CAUD|nr:hypothetical protein HOU47_gp54 [Arthrobacter phage Constance]AYN57460.1 hypothetical protein PBI_CONSTANCE_54 [Arthrobacter phage Constance]
MTTTTFVKKYPRAKITRHKTLDGWVIDLMLRATAKPIRVNATYATIPWAIKAAHSKLGVKSSQPAPADPSPASPSFTGEAPTVVKSPAPVATDAGTCDRCKRPMRPVGAKAADYPGTTLRQRKGLCQSCHQAATRPAR